MKCRLWRFMTSQWRHKAAILDFEPPSWILRMQSYSWQWRHQKIYEFVLRNILNQHKHKKVKDYLLLTSEGEKTKKVWKKKENSQNTSWVDDCYGNVNHHRHVIDAGKFSLINCRKSHKIWWLFVKPFKSYNSLKSARAQCAPPLPGRIGFNKYGHPDNTDTMACPLGVRINQAPL